MINFYFNLYSLFPLFYHLLYLFLHSFLLDSTSFPNLFLLSISIPFVNLFNFFQSFSFHSTIFSLIPPFIPSIIPTFIPSIISSFFYPSFFPSFISSFLSSFLLSSFSPLFHLSFLLHHIVVAIAFSI